MSIESRSTKLPAQPSYPQPTRAQKAAIAFAAVLVSSTLLGGMVSMFEMVSEEAAIARTSVKATPSADGLALRKVGPGSRG